MNQKLFAQRWFFLLTGICSVLLIIATILALALPPLDLDRFVVVGLMALLSCYFLVLSWLARNKAKKEEQLLQFYQKSSGDWLTNPRVVKKIIAALQQRPVKEVEDFYRDLQYQMHSFIQKFGRGEIRTGFLEVAEVCLQIFHPDLNPAAARQLALKELESYKQRE